jgi:hypothetical protein
VGFPARRSRATIAAMRDILIEHARRYPCWELDDVYKLIHQGAMGSKHEVASSSSGTGRVLRAC